MTPSERNTVIEEIRARHAYADHPCGNGVKNINLVYSGLGKKAHADRGTLLEMVRALPDTVIEECAVRLEQEPSSHAEMWAEIIRSLKTKEREMDSERAGNPVTRNTPELDKAIDQLERLALSNEPRTPYEHKLTNLVLVLAQIVRQHHQQV